MNVIRLILVIIGAVVVFGILCLAIGAAIFAWQIRKMERDEFKAVMRQRRLAELERLSEKDDDGTRPYPPGVGPEAMA